MKIDPEIISKLTKILRLAGDKAAQPGEVEAAMAKARAIAVQHNIELSSVDLSDDTKTKEAFQVTKDSTLKTRSQYQQPYHRWIYNVIRHVFGVHVILSGYPGRSGYVVTHIHLIGDPLDVAIAKEIFPFLEKVFPATLSRAVSAKELTYSMADTNGCYSGICAGIIDTNQREEEKAVKSGTTDQQYALVLRKKEEVVEEAVEEMFPDAEPMKGRQRQFSSGAFVHGMLEGRKINLRQIGPAAKANQLR